MSFTEFDQQGAVASSARALASRGCFAEAVKANLDYLVTGPELSDYERNVIRFHTGQYLAQIGEEKAAAAIIAGTRRGVDPARPAFDWDGYVAGVYAFLIKDRALLDAMTARLARQANPGNDTNGKVLRRFQLCFDQPFRIAYGVDPRCDPQAERGGVSPAEGR